MGNFLSVFRPKQPQAEKTPVISVPDIKEYLVREYERVQELKNENDRLNYEIEQTREVKLKLDAALVTLAEYSQRQDLAKVELQREKARTQKAREEADRYRDLANTYKIQLNNVAVTKEQMREEIAREVTADIVARIRSIKGNLSKKIAVKIILNGSEIEGVCE